MELLVKLNEVISFVGGRVLCYTKQGFDHRKFTMAGILVAMGVVYGDVRRSKHICNESKCGDNVLLTLWSLNRLFEFGLINFLDIDYLNHD